MLWFHRCIKAEIQEYWQVFEEGEEGEELYLSSSTDDEISMGMALLISVDGEGANGRALIIDEGHTLVGYISGVWIEYNQENEFMLHETTTVIKANTVWTSEVKDGEYVDFDFNTQSQLSEMLLQFATDGSSLPLQAFHGHLGYNPPQPR